MSALPIRFRRRFESRSDSSRYKRYACLWFALRPSCRSLAKHRPHDRQSSVQNGRSVCTGQAGPLRMGSGADINREYLELSIVTRDRERDDSLRTEKGRGQPWEKRVGSGSDTAALGPARGRNSTPERRGPSTGRPTTENWTPSGNFVSIRFGPSTSSAGSDQVPSTGERTVEALIRDLRQLMISSRAIWMSRTLLRRCNPLENVYLKSSERPIGAIDHRSTMRKSRRSRPLRKLSGVFEVNGRLTLRIREPTVDWEVNAARMAPSLLRSQRAVPIYNATTVAEIPLGLILLSLIHPRPVNHRSEFRG